MSSKKILSLIIPAYQAERTIVRALNSATAWEGDDLEIIVVNDGSTDGTLCLLQDEAAKDSRIRIITQENKGRSAARNTGIAHAQAEWVMFLDSDDYLLAGWSDLVKSTFDIPTDLIVFSYKRGYKQESPEETNNAPLLKRDACISLSEMKDFLIDGVFPKSISNHQQYEWNSCCARLYRNNVLQKMAQLSDGAPFPLGIRFSEDRIFNLTFLDHARFESIHFFDSAIYFWDLVASSTVSRVRFRDIFSITSFSSAVAQLQLDEESSGKLLASEVLARISKSACLPLSQLPKAAKTWNVLLSKEEISRSVPYIPRIKEGSYWFNKLPVFGITHKQRFLALLYWHIVYKIVDLVRGIALR